MSPLQFTSAALLLVAAASADAEPSVTIMQIQGRGPRSPLEGEAVRTEGIVTLCSRNRQRCWIQAPAGDQDPGTSDGIALDLRGVRSAAGALRPGDRVELHGRVRERQFGSGLPLTELSRIEGLRVRSRGHALPDAVPIRRLPDRSVAEAIAFWEPLEGMRVRLEEAVVVGPTSRFGEFVAVAAANAVTGSGYAPSNEHLLLQPLEGDEVDYNPERIIIDDEAKPAPALQPGDRLHDVLGVADYSFGNYKVQLERMQARRAERHRPAPPKPLPGLRLATFNLENLFDPERTPDKQDERSTPDPQAFDSKLAKLTLALTRELQSPAIVAVQEAENTKVLELLAARLNHGDRHAYRAVSFDSSDPRGIEVGVLWDSAQVRLLHAAPLNGRDYRQAFGDGAVSPGREPLVAEFEYRGQTVTVVVNHFKSKAGDDPLFGARQPPRRATEAQRKLQARAVRTFVERKLRENPQALLAVVGDLNDFSFAEPGEGPDHPLAILRGSGATRLEDLATDVPFAQRYSFIFDGNSQLLDHILVSPALRARVAKVRIAHFNADFPHGMHADPRTPLRASDHDPLEATFRIH